jgi:general stress protein 26
LIRDKQAFKDHWTRDLDRWFEQSVDTPSPTLIKIHAQRIKYWDGETDGELRL